MSDGSTSDRAPVDASPADAPPSEPSRTGLASIYAPMAAVAAVVILADVLTKQWADGLELCQSLAVRPTIGFCRAYNQGMAFSVGWGAGALIAAVALAIVAVLVIAARKVPLHHRLLMGAVAGGAIGNVIDRAFRAPVQVAGAAAPKGGFMNGAVVDFVYTKFWATFNVADSCIVVGGILLAIALWRLPDPEPETSPESGAQPSPDDPAASKSTS
ncbi:MAG: signal peptidase II [Acidimicrobiales bacterium]